MSVENRRVPAAIAAIAHLGTPDAGAPVEREPRAAARGVRRELHHGRNSCPPNRLMSRRERPSPRSRVGLRLVGRPCLAAAMLTEIVERGLELRVARLADQVRLDRYQWGGFGLRSCGR